MMRNGSGRYAAVAAVLLLLGMGFTLAQPAPQGDFRREVILSESASFAAGDQDIRVEGDVADSELGSAIAFGDVNGDGIDDLVMGERGGNRVTIYFGRVALDPNDVSSDPNDAYVVTTSAIPSSDFPDVLIECGNCSADAEFGFSVAVGEVTDDAFADILIGAPFDDQPGGTDPGRAFVVEGRASGAWPSWPTPLDASSDADTSEISSSSNQDDGYFLGFAVAAGDMDGDGIGEVAVSSRNANYPLYASTFSAPAVGAIHIVSCGSSIADVDLADPASTCATVRVLMGVGDEDYLGEHLAFCNVDGDVDPNGNDIQDLVAGAIGVDNTTSALNAGAMFVAPGTALSAIPLFDPNAPTTTVRLVNQPGISAILGQDQEDSLGFTVACGDIDGDGFDDPAAGAFFASGQGNNTSGGGEVLVFYGSASFPNVVNLRGTDNPDIRVLPSTSGDQLGFSLSYGNMNCDMNPGTGRPMQDLIMGARRYDPQTGGSTYVNAGGTFVLRGAPKTDRPGLSGDPNNPVAIIDLALGTFNSNNPGVRPGNFPTTPNSGNPFDGLCDPADPDSLDPSNPNPACAIVSVFIGTGTHFQSGFANAAGDFNGDGCYEAAVGAVGDLTRLSNYEGRIHVVGISDFEGDGVSDLSDEDDDNDCLSDNEEVGTVGSDPLDPDTDDDGLQDGTETGRGTDPALRGSFLFYDPADPNFSGTNPPDCSAAGAAGLCCLDFTPGSTTDPLVALSDADTLLDGTGEDLDLNGHLCGDDDNDGSIGAGEILCESDPANADTDGDGLDDDLEDLSTCPLRLDADSDDDGLDDGNDEGFYATDPCDVDSDGDGLQDGTEIGLTTGIAGPNGQADTTNGEDGTDPGVQILDADSGSTTTDPADQDSDDDCLPDGCIGSCSLLPPPLGVPILQGEDVNRDGAVDGTTVGTGTVPAAGTETDPTNPDTDGDGLPDGLEWGTTAAICGSLTPATPTAGNVDSDPTSFTDPRDTDTDEGSIDDGTEDTSATGTANGAVDFDPFTFVCDGGGNPLNDTNNETNPNDGSDDRVANTRTPLPDFADPNNTVVTTYLQDDLLVVLVGDADENRDPAVAESITLNPADDVDPNTPGSLQGLVCFPDDPAQVSTTIDTEPIVLTETGVDTGVFRGTLSLTDLLGSPGDGALNCLSNNRVRLGYRDDDDLCDQRSTVADVVLAQVSAATPGPMSPTITTPLSSVEILFDQDLGCASATGAFTVDGTVGPAVGTLVCDRDPAFPAFGDRRLTLSFASPLPDDLYTVTVDCDLPAPAMEDENGFRADCQYPCVTPAPGDPAYCTGVLTGNGFEGGTFSYQLTLDTDDSPSVTATSPADTSTVGTAPTAITADFSEAMDPATITTSTFTLAGTTGPVVCSSVTYDAGLRRATCNVAALPDDQYTATLDGTTGSPIRDLAGNALDGDDDTNPGGDHVFTFTVDADTAPAAVAALPANGDTVNTAPTVVTVDFEEAMDPATITATTFQVTAIGGAVTADSVTYNAALRRASFNFAAGLPDDMYTVTLVGDPNGANPSVRDFGSNALDGELVGMFPTGDGAAGGNLIFSFWVDADQSPAMLTASPTMAPAPGPGPIAVAAPTAVTVDFEEQMAQGTLTASSFTVAGTAGAVTPDTVTYDPANLQASFNFAAGLPDDAYKVSLLGTGGSPVEDLVGNDLDGEYLATFPTGNTLAGGDFAGYFVVDADSSPTASAVDPNSGQILTTSPTFVTVGFSEAMDEATITSATLTLAGSNGPFPCSSVVYNASAREATCNIFPLSLPLPDDQYTVTVVGSGGTPVTDLAGNALDGNNDGTTGDDFTYTFVVDADSAPQATAGSPADGSVALVAPTVVTVDFAEVMDGSTITASTFTVVGTAGAITPDSVTFDTVTRRASFNFAAGFPDDMYTVTLDGSPGSPITDFAGNALDGELTAGFPTGDGTAGGDLVFAFAVDVDSSPSVTATSPTCDSTSASAVALVTVDFSEAMSGGRFDIGTVQIQDQGDPNIVYNLDPNSVVYDAPTQQVMITPDAILNNGAYRIFVAATAAGTDIIDLNVNLLDGDCAAGDPARCEAGELPSGNGVAGGDFICEFSVGVAGVTFRVDDWSDPPGLIPGNNEVITTSTLPQSSGGTERILVRVSERPDKPSVTSSTWFVDDTAGGGISCSYDFPNYDPPGPVFCNDCNMRCKNSNNFPDDRYTVTLKGDPNNASLQVQPKTNSTTNFLDGEFGGTLPSGNGTPGGDFVYSFYIDADAVPAVTAMAPAPDAVETSPTSTIDVTFDQRMDPATLDPNTFTVVDAAAAPVAGTVSWDAPTETATFTAGGPLADDTYTVTVDADGSGTDVRDYSFPTGNALDGDCSGGADPARCEAGELPSGDSTAGGNYVARFTMDTDQLPQVTAMTPTPATTITGSVTTVTVGFDQEMDAATIDASTFTVVGASVGSVTADTITYDSATDTATFTFGAGFADDDYTVTLDSDGSGTDVSDGAGNALDGEFTGPFPSGDSSGGGDFVATFTVDNTGPVATGMSPAPASTSTTAVTAVTVTFDEDIDPATLTAATFTVVGGVVGPITPDSVSFDAPSDTATFAFAAGLPDDTYTVTLDSDGSGTDVTDLVGNALDGEFLGAFNSGDGTPGGSFVATFIVDADQLPTVTGMTPTPATTVTGSVTAVTVTFDQEMDPNTIDAATFTVVGGVVGAVTADSVTYDSVTDSATFNFAAGLADDGYTVTLDASTVADLAGNALDGEFVATFPSGDGTVGGDFIATFTVDNTGPVATAMTPAPASISNAAVTAVTVTFDEDIDAATLTATTFTVVGGVVGAITPDSVTFDAPTDTATFAFAAGLPDDTYTVTLDSDGSGTDVTDLAGNALDGEFLGAFNSGDGTPGGSFVASFTVDADQLPTVTGMVPVPLSINTTAVTAVTVAFDQEMDPNTIDATSFTVVGGVVGAVTPDSVTYDSATDSATFNFAAGLADDGYTVTLDASTVADLAGNTLDGEFGGGFPSGDGSNGGDFVATFTADVDQLPAVTLITPAADSVNGPGVAAVTVAFDQTMDAATITAATFTVVGASIGAITPDSVNFNPVTNTATFAFAAGFADDTYTVTLDSSGGAPDVADLAGNLLDGECLAGDPARCEPGELPSGNATAGGDFVALFTVDGTAPTVTASVPAPDSAITSAVTAVTVTFDEDIDPATLTAATFTVVGDIVGSISPDSVTFDAPSDTATFAFAAGLPDDDYTVTIDGDGAGTDVADLLGNAVDGECAAGNPALCESGELPSGDGTAGGSYVMRFNLDADALPTVTAMTPDPNTTTGLLTAVSVTFDQPMDAATLTASSFTVVGLVGGAVTPDSVTYDAPSNTATFTFNNGGSGLDDDDYTVTLDASPGPPIVADLAGNALDGEFAAAFPSGNGTAGGDFVATFTVDAVPAPPPPNPGTVSLEVDPAGIVFWSLAAPPGGGASEFNLYRGDTGILLGGGSYTQDPAGSPEALAMCGLSATSYDDGFAPGSGKVAFYLVASVESGVEGGLGTDSAGLLRPSDGLCGATTAGGSVLAGGADREDTSRDQQLKPGDGE